MEPLPLEPEVQESFNEPTSGEHEASECLIIPPNLDPPPPVPPPSYEVVFSQQEEREEGPEEEAVRVFFANINVDDATYP